jgi:phage-related holin
MPTAKWLVLVGFFVASDFVTGVFASIKRGEMFTSNKAFRSIPKFIVYGICVLIARFMEVYFISDFPAVKFISAFIAYIELKSINENIESITGHSIFSEFIKLINPKRK